MNNMNIEKLKPEVISQIRSSFNINSVTQCVTELVLNSLDANSTAIAVRINLITLRIQVIDNGKGISKENLQLVGQRYRTNKCFNLNHMEKIVNKHGFRGEALASISNMSKLLEITSKLVNTSTTYSKTVKKGTGGNVILTKNRPSYGTTVTIEGFLSNLPVRKMRIKPEFELDDLKTNLERIVIINPLVSFTLRNDLNGKLILNCAKHRDVIQSFSSLYPEINGDFSLIKVAKHKVCVKALFHKDRSNSKKHQFIYINKRPINSPKIQKFICELFHKEKNLNTKRFNNLLAQKLQKYPIFIVNIKCPNAEVDLLLHPLKTLVEFKNWSFVLRCIEKMVCAFLGNDSLTKKPENVKKNSIDYKSEVGGFSQIAGAVRAKAFKRKCGPNLEEVPEKMRKVLSGFSKDIIEETQFSGEDNIRKKMGQKKSSNSKTKDSNYMRSKNIGNNYEIKRKQNELKYNIYDKNVLNKISLDKDKNSAPLKLDNLKPKGRKVKDNYNNDEKSKDRIQAINRFEEHFIEDFQSLGKNLQDVRKPAQNPKTVKKSQNLENKIEAINCFEENLIENSQSPTKYPKPETHFKKPLPIKITTKKQENRLSSYQSQIPVEKCKSNFEMVALPSNLNEKSDNDKSFYSKFTDNELKGKDLIMEMFLKSTQVYHSEDDFQNNSNSSHSQETLMESNVNFEKNLQTKTQEVNTTMSISVKVTARKLKNKHRKTTNYKESPQFLDKKMENKQLITKVSKCLQTTFKDEIKMVSKCIQTTITEDVVKKRNFDLSTKRQFRNKDIGRKIENYPAVQSNFQFKGPQNFNHFNTFFDFGKKDLNFDHFKNDISIFHGDNANILNETFYDAQSFNNHEVDLKNIDFSPIPKIPNYGGLATEQALNKFYNSPQEIFFKRDYDFSKGLYHNVCHTKMTNEGKNILPENRFNLVNKNLFLPSWTKNEKNQNIWNSYKPIEYETKFTGNNFAINIPPFNENKNFVIRSDFNTSNGIGQFSEFNPKIVSTQLECQFNRKFNQKTDFNTKNKFPRQKLISSPYFKNSFFQHEKDLPPEPPLNDNFINNNSLLISPELVFTTLNDEYRNKSDGMNLMNVSDINHSLFPEKFSYIIDKPQILEESRELFQNDKNSSNFCNGFKATGDTTKTCNSDDQTKLIITLSDKEKRDILDEELKVKESYNENLYSELESQFAKLCSNEDLNENHLHNSLDGQNFHLENNWIKKVNTFGSNFYINKKTGTTTFYTPKHETNPFNFKKRFEFIPKGLSPVLKETKAVDVSLSQNSKNKLQNAILKSYENELLIVKWQNFIHDKDPKKFFEEVYEDKTKMYEDDIPNLNKKDLQKYFNRLNNVSFNKNVFKQINFIGQMDRKFLLVLNKVDKMLIIFDQHAIHERIRLEKLNKEYCNAKVDLEQKLSLFLPQNDISLLKRHDTYIKSNCFEIEFFPNGINILQIPLCLYNKFKHESVDLSKIVQMVFTEIVNEVKSTRGVLPRGLKVLQNVINLEACRGAIKFGDVLSKEQCTSLLSSLGTCDLPFQCAHGRPTLAPLILLTDNHLQKNSPKINLQKLKKEKNY